MADGSSTYGVPSGPVMSALMTSTRDSSTRRNIDESHATGKFVVRIASYSINQQLTSPFKTTFGNVLP
jgi:hypothetical protein